MARKINQYRRAARRDLWDAEMNRTAEDDGNTDYNPFFTRATRATRRLVATSNDTDGPLSKPNAPFGLRQDEADLEPPSTQPVHVVSHKPQLRRTCRIREGDTARKFAEIGLAFVEHGPIGTSGPFLLNPLAHQRSIIFVEYGSRNPLALGKQGSLAYYVVMVIVCQNRDKNCLMYWLIFIPHPRSPRKPQWISRVYQIVRSLRRLIQEIQMSPQ